MLTQAMPSLADSLQGALPAQVVRQMMQVLGNCNQPLEHRGPVAINPSRLGKEAGPGYYGSGSWSPEQFQALLNPGGVYNNNAFIDSTVNNSHFGGDQFLFNNDANFVTNNFPTTIVLGQPGTPGRDGISGVSGTNGVDGAPGAVGASGVSGSDGAPGAAGADGAIGPAGPPGARGESIPGLPGQPGRDGAAGILEVRDPGRRIPLPTFVSAVVAVPQVQEFKVPSYIFDSDACDVVPVEDGYTGSLVIWPKLSVTVQDQQGINIPTYSLRRPP